jgi:hypothetical protein
MGSAVASAYHLQGVEYSENGEEMMKVFIAKHPELAGSQ